MSWSMKKINFGSEATQIFIAILNQKMPSVISLEFKSTLFPDIMTHIGMFIILIMSLGLTVISKWLMVETLTR